MDRQPVHSDQLNPGCSRIFIAGMFKLTLLAALVAICVAQSTSFSGSRTADMDFLHKQKKIFDLLLYVRQADLSDAEWYDIGRNYNVETNMDMYKDKVILHVHGFMTVAIIIRWVIHLLPFHRIDPERLTIII